MTGSADEGVGGRTRRLRRLGWWLGFVPALLCAIPGIGLWLWPTLQRLPQQDRPYGWLFDRLAPVAGTSLLLTSAIFTGIALLMFARARRMASSGG